MVNPDKSHQSFTGFNSSPSRDIAINELNSIKIAEGSESGAVLLKLNRNDRLLINSEGEDMTKVVFMPMNGSVLKADIYNTGLVALDFRTE